MRSFAFFKLIFLFSIVSAINHHCITICLTLFRSQNSLVLLTRQLFRHPVVSSSTVLGWFCGLRSLTFIDWPCSSTLHKCLISSGTDQEFGDLINAFDFLMLIVVLSSLSTPSLFGAYVKARSQVFHENCIVIVRAGGTDSGAD